MMFVGYVVALSLISMLYTFSPNWYKLQCLHFTDSSLYYCSNYLLYRYHLPSKAVTGELCFRQIALSHKLNHRDIKISAIASNPHNLLVGINQPYIVLVDRHTFTFQGLIRLDGFESVEYVYAFKEGPYQSAILCNKDGQLARCRLEEDNKMSVTKVEAKHKLSGVKAIYCIQDMHIAVFTKGTILIYHSDFSAPQKHVEVNHQDTIYSVDCFEQGAHTYFAFLTKSKDAHMITLFEYSPKQDFPLEQRKKVEEIGSNIKRFMVTIIYPKKFAQKLKNNLKASMSIKLLSPSDVVLTGKFGEIMTIHSQQILDGAALNLKPYSNQEREQQFSVWADSRHYKEIYSIYSHCGRLYMVSTDHNLTVWQTLPNKTEVKYLFSVKFLTSPVLSFFTSQDDPRNVFALLKDSNIRSFSPLEEGSHQLAEYWKFSKKYTIKKACCHPSEQGIMALVTECNRVQLYDIYQDRLMKLVEMGEDVLNISFELPSVEQQLEAMFKVEFKEETLQYVSHFAKKMENKTVLLVQTNKHVVIIGNLGEKEAWFRKADREKRLERVHQNRYWDGRLLLCSQTKHNQLYLFLRLNSKCLQSQVGLSYQQGWVMFKSQKDSTCLDILNFKGSKLAYTRTLLHQAGLEVKSTTQIVLRHQIDYLHVSYDDWRVAVYSQREDAIIVLRMDLLVGDKYEIGQHCEESQMYRVSSKIDTLCFYLDKYLIMGTKDQSIRVVPYQELQLLSSPKRKEQNKPAKPTELKLADKKEEVALEKSEEKAEGGKQRQDELKEKQGKPGTQVKPEKEEKPDKPEQVPLHQPSEPSQFLEVKSEIVQ